ncbi:MAG: penicillin acylase family protein [Pseudomonadota bacterium]
METDIHLRALAMAVETMAAIDMDISTELGKIQRLVKGDATVSIAGGYGDITGSFGVSNSINSSAFSYTGLTNEGYKIQSGDGFILLVEFVEDGINARSLLRYSQSNNPNSPHYFDQAELIEKQEYKSVLFTEEEIEADPNKRIRMLALR